MDSVCGWFLLLPERRLRLVAVPGVFLTGNVAVKNRFMLELIAAETPGESVLSPNNLAANLQAGRLECILELALPGGRMADVERRAQLGDVAVVGERRGQELLKLLCTHPVAVNLQPVLRIALVID